MDSTRPIDQANGAPLSYEQEQLRSLNQSTPGAGLGHLHSTVAMRGEVDAVALRESLAAFVGRHEIWRTIFPIRDGQPRPLVEAEGRWTWSVADLSGLGRAEAEEEAGRRAHEQAGQHFDLERGPLLRALLVRVEDQDHRLFLSLHRIIADTASLTDVFLPELRELYEAQMQDRPARLYERPPQYADYARWQRSQIEAHGTLEAQLRFWETYLAGAPTVLELPGDRLRPAQRTYGGERLGFALTAELSAGLRKLSRDEQVTLSTTLTAAFQVLLSRYTGREDFLMELLEPGRERVHRQQTVGCFAAPAVLRADLAGAPSVRELLRRTHAGRQETRGHEDVPFGALVKAVHPEADPSREPLVQVQVAFGRLRPVAAAGWELSPDDIPSPTSRFDLGLEVDEHGSEVTGRFTYNRDLFERETVARMIEHWRMLLAGMVAEPWLPVGQLQLLPRRESQVVLREWSAGADPGQGPDVEDLITEQATARPRAVAVVCEGDQLTYGQLNERSNQLARYLRKRGVGPEVPVGVCLERSFDQVIALVAILKAGGAYVPLDPEAPDSRTQYVVQDTRMPLLLTHHALAERAGQSGTETVSLDRTWEVIRRESAERLGVDTEHGQLAYVIYTSGSTGKPKGVMVERDAITAHCRGVIKEYALGPNERVLQFSQFSFDASLEQILPTLATGGRLVMRGPSVWLPRQLLEEVRSQQVTVMNLPPAYWHQVVREWEQAPDDLVDLRLRLVIVGGDRLGAEAVQLWRQLGLRGVRLLNAYGPTETTITATLAEVDQDQDRITIGRPLAGRSVYILDRNGQPVPVGVPGELHIGGRLLARGYLNQPGLTKERFVPDPFTEQGTGRLYRTGDLARYLADGRIEYAGREDHQVKIRGYRIELGEIEAALGQYPAIDEAVVVVRGEGGDKELVAYVVTGGAEPLPEGELRGHLRERLPGYMQPSVIVQLEKMPRLASGKPDRRGLPEVEQRAGSRSGYLAPRLLSQHQLVQLWEELLEERPIGIGDNFFDLGGHSLLAVQLVGRIEQVYGKKLELSTLFANPTIEQLAQALEGGEHREEAKTRVHSVQTEGTRRPFFFLHGDWTGGAWYCFPMARACGPDQPFYAVEPYRFSAEEPPPTLEGIAAAHIAAMREIQPRGPYRLGGYCNGGLLAYQMALQLEAAGEVLEHLELINPSPPNQFSALRRVCDRAGQVMHLGIGRRADLYLRARHAQRHLYRTVFPGGDRVRDFGKLLDIEPRLERMLPPREALYKDYVGLFNWAVYDHRTELYGGKISFLWARKERKMIQFWQPMIRRKPTADVRQHEVEGTLLSCITDHVEGTAERLGASLARVDQDVRGVRRFDGEGPGIAAAASGNGSASAPTAPPVRIRSVRAGDLAAVVAIERTAFPRDPWTLRTLRGWLARTAYGNVRMAVPLERLIRLFWFNQALFLVALVRRLGLRRPSSRFYLVAESDATVVGYACLDAVPGSTAGIQTIAVRRDHEGEGIGTAMLAHLIALATERGCPDVNLYVRADNERARMLYRRTGFSEDGVLPCYYQPSGTDALVMRLHLPRPTTTAERNEG